MGQPASIDNAPWSPFLVRMVSMNLMSYLAVGYVFGALAIVMGSVSDDYGVSAGWKGLLTAGALIGIFFGALLGSWLADRLGRHGVLMSTLLVTAAASFAYLMVWDKVSFLVLRILVGVGVGTILSIAAPLLSEFSPRKRRSSLLSNLNVVWMVGFIIAYYGAFWVGDRVSWKWVLATAFLPMLVAFVLGLRTPESIRWLVSKGRVEEARALVKRHYGADYDVGDLTAESNKHISYRVLFGSKYRARTAFSVIFYTAQVSVFFAVYLFLPEVLDGLKLGQGNFAYGLVDALTLVAMIVGVWLCARLPRRGWVIWSFWICAAASAVLGLTLPIPVAFVVFLVFIFVLNAASNLEFVYPPELFPTEVRASGQGVTVAGARIGSVLSTWVFPSLLLAVGISWTMVIFGGVCAIGAIASHLWAPETRDLTLLEASGVAGEPRLQEKAASEPGLQEA